MARQKSVESCEKEILKDKGQRTKAKNRYATLADLLAQLQKKKNQQEVKRIMEDSGKALAIYKNS